MIRAIIEGLLSGIKVFSDMAKRRKESRRIKEDAQLAEAIRNGNSELVGKIRERRKRYKDLLILMFIPALLLSGCASTSSIVLTEGGKPYKLQAGVYTDVQGNSYSETDRWSISEADLFRDTQDLNKDTMWPTINFEKYGPYISNVIMLLIALRLFRQKKTP